MIQMQFRTIFQLEAAAKSAGTSVPCLLVCQCAVRVVCRSLAIGSSRAVLFCIKVRICFFPGDLRPLRVEGTYPVYVDGEGFKHVGMRGVAYCPECKPASIVVRPAPDVEAASAAAAAAVGIVPDLAPIAEDSAGFPRFAIGQAGGDYAGYRAMTVADVRREETAQALLACYARHDGFPILGERLECNSHLCVADGWLRVDGAFVQPFMLWQPAVITAPERYRIRDWHRQMPSPLVFMRARLTAADPNVIIEKRHPCLYTSE
jgi:hypothetical protein